MQYKALNRRYSAVAPLLILLLLAIGVVLSLCCAVMYGPVTLSFRQVWQGLLAPQKALSLMDNLAENIIWLLRLPRSLQAAVSGAGLALAGAVLQSLTRNPLADPWVLGISSGASTGAVLVIVLGFGAGLISVPLGAFVGALCAFALVLLLARHALAESTVFFVLTGVAITQLLSAVTSLITLWRADADTTRGMMFWLLGSFSQAQWSQVMLCLLTLIPVFMLCWLRAAELDAMSFGNLTAASLGVNVAGIRLLMYCLLTVLTAVIVASGGAIGFIGLTVPHIARRLIGHRHRLLLPTSLLCGAIFTVVADTLARTLFAPRELPVGILTALIGVPVFLCLIARRKH